MKREVIAAAVLNTFVGVWDVTFAVGELFVDKFVCPDIVELLFDLGCERSRRWFEFKWFNTSATLKI